MAESLQHKLDRIRTPRVHITYDVEIGNAIERRELAFVVGILADLSGMRETELPPIKQRKFVEIDRDNFNNVMQAIRPHLHIAVPKHIGDEENANLAMDLYFENFEDFNPLKILKQVPEIKTIYETRSKIKDLMTKLDGNDALEKLLSKILKDDALLAQLKSQLPPPKVEGGEETVTATTSQEATSAQTAPPSPGGETPAPEGGNA